MESVNKNKQTHDNENNCYHEIEELKDEDILYQSSLPIIEENRLNTIDTHTLFNGEEQRFQGPTTTTTTSHNNEQSYSTLDHHQNSKLLQAQLDHPFQASHEDPHVPTLSQSNSDIPLIQHQVHDHEHDLFARPLTEYPFQQFMSQMVTSSIPPSMNLSFDTFPHTSTTTSMTNLFSTDNSNHFLPESPKMCSSFFAQAEPPTNEFIGRSSTATVHSSKQYHTGQLEETETEGQDQCGISNALQQSQKHKSDTKEQSKMRQRRKHRRVKLQMVNFEENQRYRTISGTRDFGSPAATVGGLCAISSANAQPSSGVLTGSPSSEPAAGSSSVDRLIFDDDDDDDDLNDDDGIVGSEVESTAAESDGGSTAPSVNPPSDQFFTSTFPVASTSNSRCIRADRSSSCGGGSIVISSSTGHAITGHAIISSSSPRIDGPSSSSEFRSNSCGTFNGSVPCTFDSNYDKDLLSGPSSTGRRHASYPYDPPIYSTVELDDFQDSLSFESFIKSPLPQNPSSSSSSSSSSATFACSQHPCSANIGDSGEVSSRRRRRLAVDQLKNPNNEIHGNDVHKDSYHDSSVNRARGSNNTFTASLEGYDVLGSTKSISNRGILRNNDRLAKDYVPLGHQPNSNIDRVVGKDCLEFKTSSNSASSREDKNPYNMVEVDSCETQRNSNCKMEDEEDDEFYSIAGSQGDEFSSDDKIDNVSYESLKEFKKVRRDNVEKRNMKNDDNGRKNESKKEKRLEDDINKEVLTLEKEETQRSDYKNNETNEHPSSLQSSLRTEFSNMDFQDELRRMFISSRMK